MPGQGKNLYGSHPFLINLENSGHANGLLLLNSNAVQVELKQEAGRPSAVFRTHGGILHFVMFVGDSMKHVVELYTEWIGRPFFPPIWALGYQLSRWGFNSSDEVVSKYQLLKNRFPIDSIGLDIDILERNVPFTISEKFNNKIPLHDALNANSAKIVVNLSWLLKADSSYKPFLSARSKNLLLQDTTGKVLMGRNYPGKVAFPDFTDDNSDVWWSKLVKDYFDTKIRFDGLLLDINEPKSWPEGTDSVNGLCPHRKLESLGIDIKFDSFTICPSAIHTNGLKHYDLHNLYAWYQTQRTHKALKSIDLDRRWLIISRGTFLGSGRWAGHWTGDISSSWEHLRFSIPHLLTLGLVGLPLVGADICGYRHRASPELCVRWHQVGALYPLSRNHNRYTAPDQDPLAFSSREAEFIKNALLVRYQLMLYIYTQFYYTTKDGLPVMRPLVLEFSDDPNVKQIETQFLVGPALLACPVLEKGVRSRNCYFPPGYWYEFHSLDRASEGKETLHVPAPLGSLPLFVRAGTILPFFSNPGTLTAHHILSSNWTELRVFLNATGAAEGKLFLDDGSTELGRGKYSITDFNFRNNSLIIRPVRKSKRFCKYIREIIIAGLDDGIILDQITVSEYGRLERYFWTHDADGRSLVIRGLPNLTSCGYKRISLVVSRILGKF